MRTKSLITLQTLLTELIAETNDQLAINLRIRVENKLDERESYKLKKKLEELKENDK